jgi:hypothetical protein
MSGPRAGREDLEELRRRLDEQQDVASIVRAAALSRQAPPALRAAVERLALDTPPGK